MGDELVISKSVDSVGVLVMEIGVCVDERGGTVWWFERWGMRGADGALSAHWDLASIWKSLISRVMW